MFQNLAERRKRWTLIVLWSFWFFAGFQWTLLAADDEKTEPMWVISWAMFGFLFAVTILLFARCGGRADSALNREEQKQVEQVMLDRIKKRKRQLMNLEEEDDDEDEDEDDDEAEKK